MTLYEFLHGHKHISYVAAKNLAGAEDVFRNKYRYASYDEIRKLGGIEVQEPPQ